MIEIVENTLRDGSYVVDFQMTAEDHTRVAGGLADLGFKYIEVGHGLGLCAGTNPRIGLAKETDAAYIDAARAAAPNAQIGVFFIPGIGTKDAILEAKEHGIDFIRIGNNVDRYEAAQEYVEYAASLGLMVCVNLMKSYGVKSYEFTKTVKEIDKWDGIEAIYLVDSAGCMTPDEVYEYVDRTREQVRSNIGFHGHNNLDLAVANSLAAISAGAKYVDTCVRGMGRSAGNAQTEIMVHLLQKKGLWDNSINLYDLYDFANSGVVPMMPRQQGLTDEEIHIGVSKFHTSFMPHVNKAADAYPVDKRRIIKEVSDVNCINPSEELFLEIASGL